MSKENMKFLNLHIVRLLLIAFTVLSATTSCYDYNQIEIVDCSDADNYINVTVTVSASTGPQTRAPQGGENGDGRESGIETRETAVSGVTLIFFQQSAGINASEEAAQSATIDYTAYYGVYVDTNPQTDNCIPGEVCYTTGDQQLTAALKTDKTYHMLVVANADLTGQITAGTTTLADVRNMVLSSVFAGTGIGANASTFVMSSEKDAVINFVNATYNSTTNRRTFKLDNVHLERMSARIDYCTKGAEYDATLEGYKYDVGMSGDYFVIKKVTPFNLYNENEYLFKRVQNHWSSNPATTYLGDETESNYVVDPNTANKDNSQTFTYLSPIAENMYNDYTQTMSSLSPAQVFTDANSNENIIIAYTKENTLMPTSSLIQYATGIAFEGIYHDAVSDTDVPRVYYHYLRHQGELSTGSYQAKQWADLDANETCGSSPAMNYGVVRNNIYRISIEGISTLGGTIKIKIEEEKWRHVDNPTIYI